MIVMYPDQSPAIRRIGDGISKQLVDKLIGLPRTVVEENARLIMDNGPEDAVWTV